jgi:hypothetical protein
MKRRGRIDYRQMASNGMSVGDWVWGPCPLEPGRINRDAPFACLGQIISLCTDTITVMVEYPQVTSESLDKRQLPHRVFARLDELQPGPEPTPDFTQDSFVKERPEKGLICGRKR